MMGRKDTEYRNDTMNILAIDTSTKNLSLAVARDKKILRYKNQKLRRPLSSSIIPGISSILDASGISVSKLDGLAVGLGPGSFTSLRVGLATVKGLSFFIQNPVVGISSLDILAMNVDEEDVQICTLCDARRNLVYSCTYQRNKTGLNRLGEYILTDIQDVLKKLKGEVTFLGDGVLLYKNQILAQKNLRPRLLSEKNNQPQARHLIPLSLKQFQNGATQDIDQLTPLYLYPEHCQVRR